MNKINGYTEEEARNLVEYIKEGKRKGKTLTYLFETYGIKHGRAKGSVRNYYYALMKNEKGDERVVRLLNGSELSVERIREFTEEETDEALRSILAEKSKGMSVRRAIFNLSKGDDKLMLRLQNKYRNTLKKQPEKIAKIAADLGLSEEATRALQGKSGNNRGKNMPDKEFLRRRLENEINALYDRLAQALKVENERLRAENTALKEALGKNGKKQA
jgi:predicted metal-dependent hydrolase